MYVSGYIDSWSENSAEMFQRTFQSLEASSSKIEVVFLNCRGGDVFEALPSFNLIKASKKPVCTIVSGYAASMGAFLFLAASERLMSPFSRLMLHSGSMYVEGTVSDLRSAADQLEQVNADLIKLTAEATGMSDEDVKAKWFDGADHWVGADDAIAAGLATGKTDTGLLDSDPVAKVKPGAEYYDRYDARVAAALTDTNQPTEMKKKLQFVAALLKANPKANLTAESDEDVLLAEVTAQAEALVTAQARIGTLEEAARIAQEAQAEALVDAAVSSNKITAAQKPSFLGLAKADYASTKTVLDGMTAHSPITAKLNGGNGGADAAAEFVGKTFMEITAAKGGEKFLASLRQTDESKFNELRAKPNEAKF